MREHLKRKLIPELMQLGCTPAFGFMCSFWMLLTALTGLQLATLGAQAPRSSVDTKCVLCLLKHCSCPAVVWPASSCLSRQAYASCRCCAMSARSAWKTQLFHSISGAACEQLTDLMEFLATASKQGELPVLPARFKPWTKDKPGYESKLRLVLNFKHN